VILLDTNILIDVITSNTAFGRRSANLLADLAESHELAINGIIYSELSVGFTRIEDLELALPEAMIKRLEIPWNAYFLAGKAFLHYKKKGGLRSSPLPDFYIGAHAAVAGIPIATRDVSRYKTYYPKVEIIQP